MKTQWGRVLLVVGAQIALVACDDPSLVEGHFECGSAGECPSNWHCRSDNRCYSTPNETDAAVTDGGGSDGGGMDAAADDAGTRDGSTTDAARDGALVDSATGDASGIDGSAEDGSTAVDGGPPDACVPSATPVDVLLVINNAPSMADEQANFASAMPELVRAMLTGDVDDDGTPEMARTTDIHIGVVTGDMGSAGFSQARCAGPAGDDGLMQTAGASATAPCMASYPTFLSYGAAGTAGPSDATCLANAGTDGCVVRQPLEAALKALTPATSPTRFLGDTTGHGDGSHAGFFRDGSALVVIIVSNGEDCTSADPEFYDPDSTTYFGDFPNRCIFRGTALRPTSRYSDGLSALRGGSLDRLVFGMLVGIPEDLEVATYPAMLADSRVRYNFDSGSMLRRSCTGGARGDAYPPRRILTVGESLDTMGAQTAVGSICRADYTGFVRDVASTLRPALGSACGD